MTSHRTLSVFVVFFCISFATGFTQTCADSRRPELVRHTIYRHLDLRRDASTGRSYLVYSCGQRTFYSYDIDSHNLIRSAAAAEQESAARMAPPPAVNATVVTGVLGGASGAYTLRDVVTLASTTTTEQNAGLTRRIGAAIVGAVSGYYAGSYVGFRVNTRCEMVEIPLLLNDVHYWQVLAGDTFNRSRRQIISDALDSEQAEWLATTIVPDKATYVLSIPSLPVITAKRPLMARLEYDDALARRQAYLQEYGGYDIESLHSADFDRLRSLKLAIAESEGGRSLTQRLQLRATHYGLIMAGVFLGILLVPCVIVGVLVLEVCRRLQKALRTPS